MKSDISLLLLATLRIYRDCVQDAVRGVWRNWRMLLVHLSYFVLISIIAPLSMLFGGLAGGFILGMFFAVLLGHYLLTVSAAVEGDVLSFSETKSRAFEYFSPTLSVLFALFLIKLLSSSLFGSAEQYWLQLCVSLFVAVLFNPLSEVIYLRPSTMGEMFATSLEFIRENFVEWFLPILLLLLPLALLLSQGSAFAIFLGYFTSDPLHIISGFFLSFAGVSALLVSLPVLVVIVPLLYLLMTFRGQLYLRLSQSTRRKRIYMERNS